MLVVSILLASVLLASHVLLTTGYSVQPGGSTGRATLATASSRASRTCCYADAPTQMVTESVGFADEWLESALAVSRSPLADAPAIDALRDDAATALRSLSFPKRKDEAWRRTDLSSLRSARLVAPAGATDCSAMLDACTDESSIGMRLVLVDGVIDDQLTDLSALPEGLFAGSLRSAPSSTCRTKTWRARRRSRRTETRIRDPSRGSRRSHRRAAHAGEPGRRRKAWPPPRGQLPN